MLHSRLWCTACHGPAAQMAQMMNAIARRCTVRTLLLPSPLQHPDWPVKARAALRDHKLVEEDEAQNICQVGAEAVWPQLKLCKRDHAL